MVDTQVYGFNATDTIIHEIKPVYETSMLADLWVVGGVVMMQSTRDARLHLLSVCA